MILPSSPQALTAAWLSAALAPALGEKFSTESFIESFTVTPLVEDKGFYGQVVRVRLTYTGETTGAPPSLVAKFSAKTPEMRKRATDAYAKEIGFYQHLARTTPLPTPFCYYAGINRTTGDHILLLQDLAPARPGSRVAGCTAAQARIAITQIAKLHLRWWAHTRDPALDWLADADGTLDVAAEADHMCQQYDQWWPHFYQQAQPHLPAALIPFSQSLGSQRAAIRKHLFGSSPRTLIHRDYQLDNLFFGASHAPIAANPGGDTKENSESNKNEEGFAIVDWQFLSRGRGVWDVAYFLSESLVIEERRRIEMELLTLYHRTLLDQGIRQYSFEQCLYDYRVCLLQRHMALVSTLAAMPFSEEQRGIHRDILLPRNIAALLDHNAHEILPQEI
jgi:thiamine kinase-like enzyme